MRVATLLLVVLALPAAAHAAYGPRLEVSLDPAVPAAPAAITMTVTQVAGETASRAVRIEIPAAFQPLLQTQLTPCSEPERDARACPPGSQLGEAVAETSLGTFSGTLSYGAFDAQGLRFYVFLSNGAPMLDQTLEGHVVPTADGYATVLDELPDLPMTSFRLALAGGERSLLATPRECGTYVLRGAFTSQQGEQAGAEAPVEVACPATPPPAAGTAPRISALRARPGRRLVRFGLDEPAAISVRVRRAGRRVARRTASGGPGTLTVKLPRLARGRYSLRVTATDAEGARSSRRIAYRVRRR